MKMITALRASLVFSLALSMQNCDELLDALSGFTSFELSGEVTSTGGDPIEGATVTVYAVTDNAEAVDENGVVDLAALSSGTDYDTDSDGAYSADLSIANAYIVVVEAPCYSPGFAGLTEERGISENDAIVTNEDNAVTQDFVLGGGCGETSPEGGGAAPDAPASDDRTAAADFTFTVNGDTANVDLTGDETTVSISADYTGGESGFLVVDVDTGSGFKRTTQAIEYSSSFSYAVAPGYTTRMAIANEDLDSFSNAIEVTTEASAADLTAILTWDGSGDIDIHATNRQNMETIYWANKNTTWGNLDVDNTSGFGPETIQIYGESADGIKLAIHAWSCSEPLNITLRVITSGTDNVYTSDQWATECIAKDWIEFGDFDEGGGR